MADATKVILAKLRLGGNELKEFRVDNVSELPSPPKAGRMVFDTSVGHLKVYNGTEWVDVADDVILEDYQLRSEKDESGGYLGISDEGKVNVRFLPTGSAAGTVPYIAGAIKDGASLKFSEKDGGFVEFEITNLYTFCGTLTSLELDLVTGQKNGDAYNLSDERTWKGKKYEAGTTWAWEGSGWEPLAGSLDLSPYQKVENMTSAVTKDTDTYPSNAAVVAYVAEKAPIIVSWDDATDSNIPSALLTLDTFQLKLNKSDVVNDWTSATAENVPSAELAYGSLNAKTDITKAIPSWSSTETYLAGASVIGDDLKTIYISQMSSNIGHKPEEDTGATYWLAVQGSGGGSSTEGTLRSHTAYIGNSTDTTYTIYHGFSTQNVVVSIRTTAEPMYIVDALVGIADKDRITVTVTEPPGDGALAVTILAVAESEGSMVVFTQSEASDTWTINHGFGTYVFVQTFDSTGDQMFADIQQPDTNTVVISFGEAVSGYALVAAAGASDASTDSGIATASETEETSTPVLSGASKRKKVVLGTASVVTLDNASGTWTIETGKSRPVLVQMCDSTGDQIYADVKQNPPDWGTVVITFAEAVSGTAVFI